MLDSVLVVRSRQLFAGRTVCEQWHELVEARVGEQTAGRVIDDGVDDLVRQGWIVVLEPLVDVSELSGGLWRDDHGDQSNRAERRQHQQ